MNKTLRIIVITTILLALVATYLLFFRKSEDKVLAKVPITSKSVMVIDVRTLSSKLFLEDLGKDIKSSAKAMEKLLPDSLSNIDWSNNGLGLPDKVALFTLEDIVSDSSSYSINFIVPISNAKKFNLFIGSISAQLNITITKKSNIKWGYISNPGILVVWDNHFAIGRITAINNDTNVNQLIDILSTKKSQSILADTCFNKKLASKYDVLIYSRPYHKCPSKKLEVINSNMMYCLSLLNFNKGELEINTELKAKEGSLLNNVFIPAGKDKPYIVNTGNPIVSLYLQIDPEASRQLYNQYKLIDFKTNIPYFEAWNGQMNLTVNGNKAIESEYTTYEYDDNFNKVAVKTLKQEKVLDIQAVVGVNKIKADTLTPVKNGQDTLLFIGGNFVMKKNGSYFLIYNKLFPKPEIAQKIFRNNVEIEINYDRLAAFFKDIGLSAKTSWLDSIACEKIKFTANKNGSVQITGSILFSDKQKNSFYSISEKTDFLFRPKSKR